MKTGNRMVILNMLSTILAQGLAFFTAPVFSRLMGTANYGMISLFNTWSVIVAAVFSLQLHGTLHLARGRFPLQEQEQYQSSILSLAFLCFTGFSGLVLLFLKPIAQTLGMAQSMVLLMLVHSFGLFCLSLLNAKFTCEFKAGRNFILSVVTMAATVGLSLLLVCRFPPQTNYWGKVVGQTAVYGSLGIFTCLYLFPKGKRLFRREYWRFALPLALPLVFQAISGTVLAQSDRVMLQHMGHNGLVGIYSLAANFAMIVSILWTALNNSWVAFYFEFTRTGKIVTMQQRAKNYFELFTVLCCGFLLLTPEVYHIFADTSFWDGTNLILIFTLGHYLLFLTSIPVNYVLFHQKSGIVAAGTLAAALFNVALNLVLIPHFEYYGAAWATAAAQGLQLLICWCYARYLGKEDFPFRPKALLGYLGCFLICLAFAAWCPGQSLLRWLLGAGLGAGELYRVFRRKRII